MLMMTRRYHNAEPPACDTVGTGCRRDAFLVRICLMSDHDDDSLKIEERVGVVLAGLGLPYEVVRIDPAYADTTQFCERYAFPMDQSANTIIVGSKKEPKQYAACVVKATTRLDVNHAVRKLMGVSRLSFATAEETRELTGMMIGGVTVFALPDGMPLYVDEALMACSYVILGGGNRSTKIKIAPEVFRHLSAAQIIRGLAAPVEDARAD